MTTKRVCAALIAGVLAAIMAASNAQAGPMRYWVSTDKTAPITSCTSGNTASIAIADDAPAVPTTQVVIHAFVEFCRADDDDRYYGLEFFTVTGAGGVFRRYRGDDAVALYSPLVYWSAITAVCLSAAPTDRLACKGVGIDAAGSRVFTTIPTDDPRIKPSGSMAFNEVIRHGDPYCPTCI